MKAGRVFGPIKAEPKGADGLAVLRLRRKSGLSRVLVVSHGESDGAGGAPRARPRWGACCWARRRESGLTDCGRGATRLARWVGEREKGAAPSVASEEEEEEEGGIPLSLSSPPPRPCSRREEGAAVWAPPCWLWGWGERVLHRASLVGGGSRFLTIACGGRGFGKARTLPVGKKREGGFGLPSLSPPLRFPEQRNVG